MTAEAGARGWQVLVRGLVQGVGFRPTVWRLATEMGLKGQVLNDSEGVLIRVVCERREIDHFIAKLRREVPPLARIDSVEVQPLDDLPGFVGFTIGKSQAGLARTGIVPDAATCAECRDEIADADCLCTGASPEPPRHAWSRRSGPARARSGREVLRPRSALSTG